jgi:hypothetical protein
LLSHDALRLQIPTGSALIANSTINQNPFNAPLTVFTGRVKSTAKFVTVVLIGVKKDYGINGFLPKGSPPYIPFPFVLLRPHNAAFFFTLPLKNK